MKSEHDNYRSAHPSPAALAARAPHSRASRWLMPAFAACLGAAPLAQTWGRDSNAVSASAAVDQQEEIAWLSGGIGEEGRETMHAAARDYNVHVLFSSRQGAYLADIPFRVLTAAGKEVKSGTSDGPMLYLRLPAGNFKVSAEVDGTWQTRSVRVLPKGQPVSLIFLGRGDTP